MGPRAQPGASRGPRSCFAPTQSTVLTSLDSHNRAWVQEMSWTLIYTECRGFSASSNQQSAGKSKQRLGPSLLNQSN